MPSTYDAIATTTLGSASSSITFTGIPSTYTDLRLVVVMAGDTSNTCFIRYNNDSGSSYSELMLWGNGTTVSTFVAGGRNRIAIGSDIVGTTNSPFLAEINIFGYAQSIYKTTLVATSEDFNGSGIVRRQASTWQDLTAINRIDIGRTGGNFNAGTIATIYGIKAA